MRAPFVDDDSADEYVETGMGDGTGKSKSHITLDPDDEIFEPRKGQMANKKPRFA